MDKDGDGGLADQIAEPVALTVTVPAELHEYLVALAKADPRTFPTPEALASQAVEAVLRGIAFGHGVNLLALGRCLQGIANLGQPVKPGDLAEFILGRLARIPEDVAFEVFLQEVADNPWERSASPDDGEIPF